MIKRFLLSLFIFVAGFAHADWAADRDASEGYVTVTTLATAVDEAVPFVVVYLSDMPADFWTAMDAASDTDGKTIRVSTADGTTQLACVPIGVNTSTDTGCLIFLGTGMSASVDVDYRIYVGNASLSMPTASGGMGEQAVFASYAGVYFPGVDTRDWTSGGRTLTAVNTPGTAASGYEGITAATYNGTDQYHWATVSLGLPITVEGLLYYTGSTPQDWSVALGSSSSVNPLGGLIVDSTGVNYGAAFRGEGAGNIIRTAYATSKSYNTWYYKVGTRSTNESGVSELYFDGARTTSSEGGIGPTSPSYNRLAIGALLRASAGNHAAVNASTVLISSSVRNTNYVSTMADNWAGTMYTAGAWTPLDSCTDGSTGWVLFQTAATTSASGSLVDWTSTSNALVDDSNYTQAALDGGGDTDSETLKLTNPAYGTTIPTGAASYTVQFRIKRVRGSGGSNEVNDLNVQFIDDTGALVGDNLAATTTDWPSLSATTADYIATGLTLDGTEFTSAAGLAISATAINAAGAVNARVLVAWIKIDWTCGDDAAAKSRGFFALTE